MTTAVRTVRTAHSCTMDVAHVMAAHGTCRPNSLTRLEGVPGLRCPRQSPAHGVPSRPTAASAQHPRTRRGPGREEAGMPEQRRPKVTLLGRDEGDTIILAMS